MKKAVTFLLMVLIFCQCSENDRLEQIDEKPSKNPSLSGSPLPKNSDKGFPEQRQGVNQKNVPTFSHKKKRANYRVAPDQAPTLTFRTRRDSLLVEKLRYLRSENIELDLNEPSSREFLLSPVPLSQFPSLVQLSDESFFKVNFDNDILDYTDRFYTNGIRFDLVSPFLRHSFLSKLLVPYWRGGINYYGISIVQNIYTPSTTKVDTIINGDRPYSSYLYFGSFKITNDPILKYRQTSELDIGVIGPYAQGESVQKSFHTGVPPNSEPLGWEYQIKNDLLLNYSLFVEKGILEAKSVEFILTGGGSLGTLYTNIAGGFLFRTGLMNPYYSNLGIAKRSKNRILQLKNTQAYFFLTSTGKLVGYDATLQGGLFNDSNPYCIPSGDMSRFTFQGTAGLTFVHGPFRFDLEQFLLSPEFHDGWWHKWVHIGMTFAL